MELYYTQETLLSGNTAEATMQTLEKYLVLWFSE